MDVFTGGRASAALIDGPAGRTRAAGTPEGAAAASGASSTSTSASGGAIIITVSYVFSDENNPASPNRSGSLVMSLPNTPANRDPSTIQEIITLATQMAYSTIVNGFKKELRTSLAKFESFQRVADERLCPICFEAYPPPAELKATEPSASGREDSRENGGRGVDHAEGPNRKRARGEEAASATEVELAAAPAQTPKHLSDYTGTFSHVAVKMPCGHVFGQSCLFEWLKDHTTCPLCRASVADEPAADTQSTVAGTAGTQPEVTRNAAIEALRTRRMRFMPQGYTPSDSLSRIDRMTAVRPPGAAAEDTSTRGASPITSGIVWGGESVLSQLFSFLPRPEAAASPFPSGVSSRRTPHGVVTRLTDTASDNDILDGLNLRSLVDSDGLDGAEGSNPETAPDADA